MVISDLFSTSFLFSIAIVVILLGGIFAYTSYRMAEQDHKLTSMVNLVSILAQDLQFVKSKLVSLKDTSTIYTEKYPNEMIAGQRQTDLISVSDGEDDENYNDDDTNDNDTNDNDTNDNDENYNDDDDTNDNDSTRDNDDLSYNSDDEEQLEDSHEQIKLLNLTLTNDNIDNYSQIEGNIEELDALHKEDIKTIHIETPIIFEETEITIPLEFEQTDLQVAVDDVLNLKNVIIDDLGEVEDIHSSKSDYKKMSLNKLRDLVVSKNVVADASKLKKNDILKLLGDE